VRGKTLEDIRKEKEQQFKVGESYKHSCALKGSLAIFSTYALATKFMMS